MLGCADSTLRIGPTPGPPESGRAAWRSWSAGESTKKLRGIRGRCFQDGDTCALRAQTFPAQVRHVASHRSAQHHIASHGIASISVKLQQGTAQHGTTHYIASAHLTSAHITYPYPYPYPYPYSPMHACIRKDRDTSQHRNTRVEEYETRRRARQASREPTPEGARAPGEGNRRGVRGVRRLRPLKSSVRRPRQTSEGPGSRVEPRWKDAPCRLSFHCHLLIAALHLLFVDAVPCCVESTGSCQIPPHKRAQLNRESFDCLRSFQGCWSVAQAKYHSATRSPSHSVTRSISQSVSQSANQSLTHYHPRWSSRQG